MFAVANMSAYLIPLSSDVVTSAVLEAGPLHAPPFTTTLYVPGVLTVIVAPVCPLMISPFLIHSYDVPPVAVNICVALSQSVAEAGVIVPAGVGSCVITELLEAGPLQVPFVMITLYVPGLSALNVAPDSPGMVSPFNFHS